jgi:hypothetical protein
MSLRAPAQVRPIEKAVKVQPSHTYDATCAVALLAADLPYGNVCPSLCSV